VAPPACKILGREEEQKDYPSLEGKPKNFSLQQ
jgi:hypothetical protein